MSELAIQTALQTAFKAMDEFADADVLINDWTVLDQSVLKAPYVIISDADTFRSRQDTSTPNTTWEIVVTLLENFEDWTTALDNVRTRRQAIIDKVNTGDTRSAGGLEGTSIDEIRSGTPITPRYDTYVENISEAEPIYLFQDLILVCEEF